MIKKIVAIGLLAIAWVVVITSTFGQDWVRSSAKSVTVKIECPFMGRVSPLEERVLVKQGTGLFIGVGEILTDNHVVDECDRILVLRENEQEFRPAIIVSSDPVKDLAILKIDDSENPQVMFTEQFKMGDPVLSVGNAIGPDFEVSRTKVVGFGLGTLENGDVRNGILLNCNEIRPGFSGGGVFLTSGEHAGYLIGTVEAIRMDEKHCIAYVIKSKDLLKFLEEKK